ncbi:excalibur calcium-binding domain-containing protein [Geodermatophilus maliterrae]|uniref:Excalibur calcium-binding domain-containing protein n=1 Tax=Geodermatophilus maliterrae TaxID=3162531 RepID=A0ABV3XF43_9ACTN
MLGSVGERNRSAPGHLEPLGERLSCRAADRRAGAGAGRAARKPAAGRDGGYPAPSRPTRSTRPAGAAPVRAGQPGYGRHLDRDGDGVGCERARRARRSTDPRPRRPRTTEVAGRAQAADTAPRSPTEPSGPLGSSRREGPAHWQDPDAPPQLGASNARRNSEVVQRGEGVRLRHP